MSANVHAGTLVRISPGELLDKISILRIKSERMTEPLRVRNVRHELTELETCVQESLPCSAKLTQLENELAGINTELWEVEDALRRHERDGIFDAAFIKLARSVYHTNDRRAAVKRSINELLNSELMEEKEY